MLSGAGDAVSLGVSERLCQKYGRLGSGKRNKRPLTNIQNRVFQYPRTLRVTQLQLKLSFYLAVQCLSDE